jgi:glycosyltransferase involved in cell wall biosynthesis
LAHHRRSWHTLKKRGAEIITASLSAKRDLIELLDIEPHKIHVIYEGLPAEFKQVGELLDEEEYERIKNRLGLNRPFLLFVGTREPRKNLLRLIDAWQPLAKEVELLIVGEAGWDQTSGKRAHQQGLRFLGKVSDKELSVLYGEASVFVFPSLYEGFGFPILEAFHHGTPVVTSNISSMPEVAGNAAELVDPQSVESIRQGITTIMNESLAEQKKRLQKMIIRLQMYDWRRLAEETTQVYRIAAERR